MDKMRQMRGERKNEMERYPPPKRHLVDPEKQNRKLNNWEMKERDTQLHYPGTRQAFVKVYFNLVSFNNIVTNWLTFLRRF